jgi:hypothetical protein
VSDDGKKVITESDKQTVYCLDALLDTVNLLAAKGYPGKAVGQALLTTLARFIGQQSEPLATLVVCIRAVGICVVGEMRQRGHIVDNAAVERAYAAAADSTVEIVRLDEETLKQTAGGGGADGGKSN